MRLNKLRNVLRNWQEKMDDEIANREEICDDRTEKWQESNNGYGYRKHTERLMAIHGVIVELLDLVECSSE